MIAEYYLPKLYAIHDWEYGGNEDCSTAVIRSIAASHGHGKRGANILSEHKEAKRANWHVGLHIDRDIDDKESVNACRPGMDKHPDWDAVRREWLV